MTETSLKITEKVAFYNGFEEVDFWQFSFDNFFQIIFLLCFDFWGYLEFHVKWSILNGFLLDIDLRFW